MSEWQPTTCMRCAVGCGYLQRASEDGYGIGDARGNAEHPTNNGLECQRGVRETVDPDGQRLTEPLVRRGGVLQPTDWDTALGIVSTRFIEAITNDPGNIAVLGSGQQTNEAAYALGKLARGGFGTPYYDANTTLCMASAVRAYFQAFGSDAPPPTYDDIPRADTHLVWGANPAAAHPVLYRWIANSSRHNGGKLVVVDPVESETASDADIHIQPEPGTDLALARAVLARVIDTDRVDDSFVEENTEGFDRMVDSLPDAERAASTAGVTLDQIDRLADVIDQQTLVYWGMGVNQSVQGTGTARSLIDLCLATGNLGPGSGPFSLTGQANSMGTRVCSSKTSWPGHRDFADTEHRKYVAETWDVPVSRLPDDTGPGFVRIVDELARGDVDVCWTVATNPVAGMPDAGHVTNALDDAFLVVQDAFHSDTVECADVVLPAATWGESEGTITNMERRVSRVTAAAPGPEGARQDLDIIADIGNRIEPGLFGDPPLSPESVFDELRGLTAGTKADLSGITYDRLDDDLAVRWPAPDADSEGGYRYYGEDAGGEDAGNDATESSERASGATASSDGQWSFYTESGLAQFSNATHSSVPEPIDEEYPLTLTTGRRADVYNTGVRTRTAETESRPTARMHPETIGKCLAAFVEGQTVVESRRASVTVDVRPDDGIPPGVVWLPIHHPAANELTLPAVDPESAEPNLKQCAIAVHAPSRTDKARDHSDGRAAGTQ